MTYRSWDLPRPRPRPRPRSNVGLRALLEGPTAMQILLWPHQGLNHRPSTPVVYFNHKATSCPKLLQWILCFIKVDIVLYKWIVCKVLAGEQSEMAKRNPPMRSSPFLLLNSFAILVFLLTAIWLMEILCASVELILNYLPHSHPLISLYTLPGSFPPWSRCDYRSGFHDQNCWNKWGKSQGELGRCSPPPPIVIIPNKGFDCIKCLNNSANSSLHPFSRSAKCSAR